MVAHPAQKGVRDYPKILSMEKCQKLSGLAFFFFFLLRISRFCHIISLCFVTHVTVMKSLYPHHLYLKQKRPILMLFNAHAA